MHVQDDMISSAPQEAKQDDDADQDHSAGHSDCNGDDGGPRQRGSRRSCKAQRCPRQHQHSPPFDMPISNLSMEDLWYSYQPKPCRDATEPL